MNFKARYEAAVKNFEAAERELIFAKLHMQGARDELAASAREWFASGHVNIVSRDKSNVSVATETRSGLTIVTGRHMVDGVIKRCRECTGTDGWRLYADGDVVHTGCGTLQ